MKKMIAALAAGAALVTPLAVAAPSDAAAAHHHRSRACVTYREWRHITKGMTRTQVHRTTGIWGTQSDRYENSDGTVDKWIDYRQCYRSGYRADKWSTVSVNYENYRYDSDYNPILGAYRVDDRGMWSTPW